METCPDCGCTHIGTDSLFIGGIAMFCQGCGFQGPRVPTDRDLEDWFTMSEQEARAQWNETAQARKLQALPQGGYIHDIRFSG
jgi:hypothetical protein